MIRAVVLLSVVVTFFGTILCAENVTLRIANGKILGIRQYSLPKNNVYYSFKGLRYAQPVQRFKVATPVRSWKGIYDAREDKPICPQLVSSQGEQEDCLFLNVYTPKLPSSIQETNLTVMLWVHGGGFHSGDSLQKHYGPDYFMDHNVIIVAINYRVGIYGFVCDGKGKIPCNLGLKDTVLAMRWVKKNIQYFGGNPHNITIFGESSGASMISYLITSPLVVGKGYFKRAILQSGNSLNPWAIQRNPENTYNTFVTSVGCLSLIADATLDCLNEKSMGQISVAAVITIGILSVIKLNVLNGISYSPVIEDNITGAAIVEGSYKLFSGNTTPDVELFIGTNSEEGLFFANSMSILRPFFLEMDLCRDIIVPTDMYATEEAIDKYIAPTIWKYYFNGSLFALAEDQKIIRFLSDSMFNKPYREHFTLLQNKTTTYCYRFSYSSNIGLDNLQHKNYSGLGNVGHSEDLYYLWRSYTNDNKTYVPQAYLVRERMVRMWSNFAKTGNPTPDPQDSVLQNITLPTAWINGTHINCLDIGYNLKLVQNPSETGYKIWKHLYDMYGNPKDTY